ncbi:MAG: ParB/RepB/Spo0J family partition protein [Actinobacteria bacterium]|nr:ParB/RepB/Spo0J family partition protein [Actinomycetota bacterium]
MARAGGLGKGLGALIPPGAEETVRTGGVDEIPVASIRANSFQPRERFDEEALAELTASIREVGVLQPVLLRPSDDGGYELIAGERRWRAARRAGLQTIPALVKTADDATALEHALVENIHRADLNALEEAAAFQQLIEDFNLTHDEVARRVGKSRATVTNTLRILQLPASIHRLMQEGQLSLGHAKALLGTPDRAFQEDLAKRAVGEGLSVRAVEDLVREREASGVDEDTKRTRAKRRLPEPGLLELEELLSDYLSTRVKVMAGNTKRGRVVIEFSGLEDLERVYRLIVLEGEGEGEGAES